MSDPIRGTNMAVFILFFLMSLLEAFSRRNWVIAALWLVCGMLFLRADIPRRKKRERP